MSITIAEFMRVPDRIDWLKELRNGWKGPDGSSSSTDAICGVRIGIKSPSYDQNLDYRGRLYPASKHDYRYQLGRRLQLPSYYSLPADEAYRDGCLEECMVLVGPFWWLAYFRCHARYLALRARVELRELFGLLPWGEQPH